MKKQVIVIHGGDAWDTYEEYVTYLRNYEFTQEKFNKMTSRRWKDRLQECLGDEFLVIKPEMPNARNAKYDEWCIWFEKIMPYFHDKIIFVGHSLGAIFLAKYFAENSVSFGIAQMHFVAGCFDAQGGFQLPESLANIEKQCKDVFIYHSSDDPVVPYANALQYHAFLPQAQLVTFADRGHFLQSDFPEIVENITHGRQ